MLMWAVKLPSSNPTELQVGGVQIIRRGDRGNWTAICLQYRTDAVTYYLSVQRKLELAAVILRCDVPKCFDELAFGTFNKYDEFKRAINDRFKNRRMEECIKTHLQSLRGTQFDSNGVGPNDALISLVSTIKKNYAKSPSSWQCEENRMEIFENAAAGAVWARRLMDRLHV